MARSLTVVAVFSALVAAILVLSVYLFLELSHLPEGSMLNSLMYGFFIAFVLGVVLDR